MIDFNPESFKTPPPGVWLAPAEPPAEVPPPKTYNAPVAISAEDVDFLEQHFLGSVCHRPEKVSQGLAMLDGDDFASPACARFFQIIKRQSEIGGVDIDVARKEALGAGLSVVWLAGLTDCIPGNVDRLARQIKATANRRRAIAELKRLESGQSLAETIDALSRLRCAEGGFPPARPEQTCFRLTTTERPPALDFLASLDGAGFLPRGIVGLLSATGGTGKTYFLLSLGVAAAAGRAFGPIRILKPTSTLIVCGEDDQAEVTRRVWDIAGGEFPPNLYGVSTVGRLGPLMELQNGRPTRTAAFAWLEETIENHPGLELLILDPKSRFYGLEENDNGHATQFIQALEYLNQKHRLTILLSTHTGKALAGRNSQEMNRGASALVDGCRWQAGLVRMDKGMAEGLGINDPRRYVVLDLPKSNYGAHLQRPLILKRGENGVLTFCDPAADRFNALGTALLDLLGRDPVQYTKSELHRKAVGAELAKEMKEAFPGFSREKDMGRVIDHLLQQGLLQLSPTNNGRYSKEVLTVA